MIINIREPIKKAHYVGASVVFKAYLHEDEDFQADTSLNDRPSFMSETTRYVTSP
jgi:hypothetical protein